MSTTLAAPPIATETPTASRLRWFVRGRPRRRDHGSPRLFNVILAGVADHEVGSASGTLNAVQQLGNSIGVAVLATIFFSMLDHGHSSPAALTRTVLISAGLYVASLALSFLLPRRARMDEIPG